MAKQAASVRDAIAPAPPANADQDALLRFRPEGAPQALTSNALLVELRASLHAVDREEGRVGLSFDPGTIFLQGDGQIQGGAIACMLDFAMAFAALATVGAGLSVVTVAMNTSYLRGASTGRFNAIGEIIKKGRTLVFAQAYLSDETGRSIATATSTLSIGPGRSRS